MVRAVRQAAGRDYPVLIKLNSEDFLAGGATVDDMLVTAAIVEQAGVDAIELSGGTSLSEDYRSVRTGSALRGKRGAYYASAAKKLKKESRLPVMLVGGIRTLAEAERLVTRRRHRLREPLPAAHLRTGARRPVAQRRPAAVQMPVVQRVLLPRLPRRRGGVRQCGGGAVAARQSGPRQKPASSGAVRGECRPSAL